MWEWSAYLHGRRLDPKPKHTAPEPVAAQLRLVA